MFQSGYNLPQVRERKELKKKYPETERDRSEHSQQLSHLPTPGVAWAEARIQVHMTQLSDSAEESVSSDMN